MAVRRLEAIVTVRIRGGPMFKHWRPGELSLGAIAATAAAFVLVGGAWLCDLAEELETERIYRARFKAREQSRALTAEFDKRRATGRLAAIVP